MSLQRNNLTVKLMDNELKQNGKTGAALKSMRLRTLPLSLAGVLIGAKLAWRVWQVNPSVIVLLALTTVSLQILSNLSNELGDVLHGTDTEDRQGPAYGLNSGALTVKDMKRLIAGAAACCVVFGTAMVWLSFGTLLCLPSVLLLLLGAGAIAAAVKYTLGKNPYGYRAGGDFWVFVFFGLVSVLGAYFVCCHRMDDWSLVLPAAGIGFFSIGVLNVNNIRDMKTDAPNRVTVALKLGLKNARIYQTVLVCLGWACLIAYTLMHFSSPWRLLYLLTLPLYYIHLKGVWANTGRTLDKYLPMLVMSTFMLALLY